MKKAILIKLLTVLVIISMVLAGCQGPSTDTDTPTNAPTNTPTGTPEPLPPDDELEEVELVWYTFVDNERTDIDMVWGEINKYLKEKINTTINYNFAQTVDYRERMPAILSSGQYMDLIGTGSSHGFAVNARQEAFYPLDDLIPEYLPKTYAMVPDGAWDAVTINGHIYAVVPYKDLAARRSFLYNKTMTDSLDIKVPESNSWSTYNDLIPFLYEAKEKRDANEPELKDIPITNGSRTTDSYYPVEVINGLAVANIPGFEFYKGKGDGETVFNLYDTEEYRETIHTIKQLVDDGIIPAGGSNFDPDRVLDKDGKLLGSMAQGYIEVAIDMNAGRETAHTTSNITVMTTGYVQAFLQAISIKTDHPERAAMLLEMINTDEELANLVRWGIEGQHYEFTADGQIDVSNSPRNGGRSVQDMNYYYWYGGWWGNILAGATPTAVTLQFPDRLNELNSNSIQDTNLGFMLNTEPIVNEIAACSSVIGEYDTDNNLRSGAVADLDGALDDFIAKLEQNGSQKIVDEVQKQLTEWRSSVGKPTN